MTKEKLKLIKRQINRSDKLFEEALDFGYIFSKPKPPKINWFGEEIKEVLPLESDVI